MRRQIVSRIDPIHQRVIQIHLIMDESEARHLAGCLERCLSVSVNVRTDILETTDAKTLRNTLGVLTDEKRGYDE